MSTNLLLWTLTWPPVSLLYLLDIHRGCDLDLLCSIWVSLLQRNSCFPCKFFQKQPKKSVLNANANKINFKTITTFAASHSADKKDQVSMANPLRACRLVIVDLLPLWSLIFPSLYTRYCLCCFYFFWELPLNGFFSPLKPQALAMHFPDGTLSAGGASTAQEGLPQGLHGRNRDSPAQAERQKFGHCIYRRQFHAGNCWLICKR